MKKIYCSIEKGDWPKRYWDAQLKQLDLPKDTKRMFGEFQLLVYDGIDVKENQND